MNAESRKALFGVSILVTVLAAFVAGLLLMLRERTAEIIGICLFAGAACFCIGAWHYLLETPCPNCRRRAFVKGSLWFGSTWGVLGSKCVHCGLPLAKGR